MTTTFKYICHFSAIAILMGLSTIAYSQLAYSIHPTIFYGEDGGYLELYAGIQAKTLTTFADEAVFEYILQIDDSEDKSVFLDKYAMSIPKEQMETDYWDIQRIGLDDGDYDMTMYLIDKYSLDTTMYNLTLEVDTPTSFTLSKPVICASIGVDSELPFEKYGFKYEKLAYNLVSDDQLTLSYFQEYYQPTIDAGDQYLVKYSIMKGFHNPSMMDEPLMKGYEKLTSDKRGVYTKTFDISSLNSGDYSLLTEYMDVNQEVIVTSFQNFQVMRPEKALTEAMESDSGYEESWVQLFDKNETVYALKAIAPRVGGQRAEILNKVLREENLRKMKFFVYSYWAEVAPGQAEKAYEAYMNVAKAVDRTYRNNVGFGFENDRGFYFLKYGKPDVVITEEHEPTAPPYEIWIYNRLDATGETDIKFLFYNPSLSENDFEVLHSNSNFDVRNPDWQRLLYAQAPNEINGDFNRGEVGDNYQRNAVNYFNNF